MGESPFVLAVLSALTTAVVALWRTLAGVRERERVCAAELAYLKIEVSSLRSEAAIYHQEVKGRLVELARTLPNDSPSQDKPTSPVAKP